MKKLIVTTLVIATAAVCGASWSSSVGAAGQSSGVTAASWSSGVTG